MRKISLSFISKTKSWWSTYIMLLFMLTGGALSAQQKTISGTVTEENGNPITGVTVMVKGTTIGVITDWEGKYNLSQIPADANVLVFSYIGMLTQDAEIGDRTNINVTMKSDIINVDEVIIVGYGTQQKKTLTGAVTSVSEDELRSIPVANAASRIQGRVAGVTITNDNSPGGEATVRVRGIGSVNNNDPLYIIDGVPSTDGLSKINPNDIESMSVLKDASSSAIYGVRAANGVIIITTKRGKPGKTRLSFDARFGIQRATNQLDLLNTQEYADLLWMENRNAGLNPGDNGWGNEQLGYGETPIIPDYIIPAGKMEGEVDESSYSYPSPYNGITRANKQGTNWYDEIFNLAPVQEYNIGLSGGSENSNYAFSAGYMEQEGIVMHTGFERFSLRSNADAKVTDWLEIGESLGASYVNRNGFGNNDEGNSVSWAYRMQPIIPVYDIKGNFAGTQAATTGNAQNPVAVLTRNKDDYVREMRILANVYAQLNLPKNLTFRTLFGVDYNSTREQDRRIMDPEFSEGKPNDQLTQKFEGGIQWNWSNTLNFSTTIDDIHNIKVLLGSECVSDYWEWFNASRSVYFMTDTDYMVLDSGESDQTATGSFDEWFTFSYFGRINYSFRDKYLLEAVLRRDGSSRFAKTHRWGTFPALSAGWRISEESFLTEYGWLNDLKLRIGWGQNGNDNVGGNYNSYSTYRAHINESYYSLSGSNTSTVPGFHRYKLGNLDGKWESTTTTNVGLDITVFDSKLQVNFDWYNRLTTDMLYKQQLPSVYGYLVLPAINVGEMKNRGCDLMITYHGQAGNDFYFDIRASISHYKNEITKLNDNSNEILWGDELRQNIYTASTSGRPISSFYGYVVEGIFNTAEEIAAHSPYNPDKDGVDSYSRPGVFKYKDVNGDGKITSEDRTFIGSPHPDFTYGLNIGSQYKSWDMTMFIQGSQGNKLINYVNRWILFSNFQGNRSTQRLYESWTAERYENGDKITMPIALKDDEVMQRTSTFFVEDGSYLRIKDLQIGYTIPAEVTSKWGIERLRLYAQATNLLTITGYSGLDPEIINNGDNADRHIGVDEGVYPTSQMFLFGINLNL